MVTGNLINLICKQIKYIYDLKQVKFDDLFVYFRLQVMHTACILFSVTTQIFPHNTVSCIQVNVYYKQ